MDIRPPATRPAWAKRTPQGPAGETPRSPKQPATAVTPDDARATLLKRARAHYLSVPLAVTLAELRSPLEKSYRNTVYCTGTLTQSSGKLVAKWCGQRWCLCCNRMRTARAMNRYTPVVETWGGKQFVTLTVRNVAADELKPTIRKMIKVFQAAKLGMRRSGTIVTAIGRHWKGARGVKVGDVIQPAKLVALRKLECTYNAQRDDYHPHFHVVVENQAQAMALLERWRDHWGDAVDVDAQDTRECDNDTLREAFKYFTKLLAKQRGKTNAAGTSAPVDPRALDVIFRAMKGQRVYQPVGFRVAKDAPDEDDELELDKGTPALTRVRESIDWRWSQDAADWVDESTGECLTGYEPAVTFREFVQRIGRGPPLADLERPAPLTDEPAEYPENPREFVRARLAAYVRDRADWERSQPGWNAELVPL